MDEYIRVGIAIREVNRKILEVIELYIKHYGINTSQLFTIQLMAVGAVKCMGDINKELGLDTGASTRMVDSLEQIGLLYRQRSCVDRRKIAIHLTDQGNKIVASSQLDISKEFGRRLEPLINIMPELLKTLHQVEESLSVV